MAALQRGLRRRGGGGGRGGGLGDVVPVGGFEIGAAEGEPAVAVGEDEGLGLVLGPAGRWDPAGFGDDGGGHGWRGGGFGGGGEI